MIPIMKDAALILDFAREGRRLKVSFFEGDEKALRPYEVHEVAWQQIEKTCREILSILNRSNRKARLSSEVLNSLKKSGHLLFDLLIPTQAKEKLAGTKAKVLTLRLEDTLVHIPWELLYDGREFLCRRFAAGRVVSTRQTPTACTIRAPSPRFNVLIIADPRGDLEAAYHEGLEIKNFLDQRRDVFNVDFKSHPVDIAFVKKNLRDYDIVHYAGHANYDSENPSESGWLLSDGTLKAAEIVTMGGLKAMPALVFANACQSGQTDEWNDDDGCGQRIFGLANAFLLAGVQDYIGTFWEITDGAGSQLATRFYAFLAAGEAVGTALRNARQALVDAAGEDTVLWAEYLLYGDPNRGFEAIDEGRTLQGGRKGWNRIWWWPRPTASTSAQPQRSPLIFSLIGVFLLASVYAGYALFQSSSSKERAISATSPAPQSEMNTAVDPSLEIKAPLSLSMNIIGQRKEADGSYTEVVVREGSVLRSRDHFQVHLETNRASHIHILLFDSQGQASQLFPDPKIEQPGFTEGGRKIAIPDKDLWFWLDENRGTETIYVLASEEAMSDIRGLLRKMAQASETERKHLSGEIKQRIGIVERGVGGVTKGKPVSYALSDGRLIQKVTDVVAGSGAVVRAISFEHK